MPLQKDAGSGKFVKGFVSSNNIDRSKDIVAPESFDLDRYMVNPQLQYNHKKWITKEGNEVNIGLVRDAIVAKIVDIGDADNWGIATEDGDIVDKFSKQRCPDLTVGSRGLWVKAEVLIDDVWGMVESGELNTFSWRGLASLAKTVINGIETFFTKAIDLWECSLVGIPDNFAATFEIAKSVEYGSDLINYKKQDDVPEMGVHKVMLSTAVFTEEQAKNWLGAKGFSNTSVVQIDGEWVAIQSSQKDFDANEGMLTVSVDEGVQIAVGKQKDDSKLGKSIKEFLKYLDESVFMAESDEKETTMKKDKNEEVKENQEKEVEAKEAEKAQEEKTEKEAKAEVKHEPEKKEPEKKEAEKQEKQEPEKQEAEKEVPKEKGAVADILANMGKEKYERMSQIFKAISAFDEAVWDAPNETEDLKKLVFELAEIFTQEAGTMKNADHNAVLDEMANRISENIKKSFTECFETLAKSTDLIKSALDNISKEETGEQKEQKEVHPEQEAKPEQEEQKEAQTEKPSNEQPETKEGQPTEKEAEKPTEQKAEEPEKQDVQKSLPEYSERSIELAKFTEALGSLTESLNEVRKENEQVKEEMEDMKKSVVESVPEEDTGVVQEDGPNAVFSENWPFG